MMPNLQVFARLGAGSTKIETGLPFGHEVNSGVSLFCVGNNLCLDGSSPKLTLLGAAPSVGMGQHELNVVGHRVPAVLSCLVGGNEERLCRIKEITHAV